jgi:hypothetical protein
LAAREASNNKKHAEVPQSVIAVANAISSQFRKRQAGDSRPVARAPQDRAKSAGISTWVSQPEGITPESRLTVELPTSEFTYIERPFSHFVVRWAAIDWELSRWNENSFTLLDIGSCNGFFSLQTACGYQNCLVIGVEGSIGVGNGTTGLDGNEDDIIATKAVQTHLQWIEDLQLPNCLLAPEVWDFKKACSLANLGRPICDVMLNLSVLHHIDGISQQQYKAGKLSPVEGTVSLMAKLLLLANRHFIELPDTPWISHIWDTFRSPKEFLDAAARESGKQWSFVGPLAVSEWYGRRELWLMELEDTMSAVPAQGLKGLFQRLLARPTHTKNQSRSPNLDSRVQQQHHQPQLQQQQQQDQHQLMAAPGNPQFAHSLPKQNFGQGQQQPPTNMTMRPLNEQLGAAILAAPTALIAAHVQLRDALASADIALADASAFHN